MVQPKSPESSITARVLTVRSLTSDLIPDLTRKTNLTRELRPSSLNGAARSLEKRRDMPVSARAEERITKNAPTARSARGLPRKSTPPKAVITTKSQNRSAMKAE